MSQPLSGQPEAPRSVLVLKATVADAEPWDEGTRAVIAELMTGGYELRIRAAHASTTAQLASELSGQLGPNNLGAVALLRSGSTGLAFVYTRRLGFERLRVRADEGTLSESRVALSVVDRLRNIEVPEAEPTPSITPAPAEALAPGGPRPELWAAVGAAYLSDVSSPLPWIGLSAAVPLPNRLGFEFSVAGAPWQNHQTTTAGELGVRAEAITGFLTFDALNEPRVSLLLGLGAGPAFLQQQATARAGFEGGKDRALVALLSARVRLRVRGEHMSFVCTLDPGLLTPAVSVDTGDRAPLELGRPFVSLSAGLGFSL